MQFIEAPHDLEKGFADFARDLELENNDLREVLNKLTDSYFLHRCEGMLELMMRADRLRPLDMKGDK
jgi:hypothetical protein